MDLDGASVISVVALVFSAIGLYFGAVRPWWQTRAAHPEARLEELSYPTGQGWSTATRAVVINHGPAVMRMVIVELFDEDGEEHIASADMWIPMPVPELHVGQALHLPVTPMAETPDIRAVAISWRDRRARPQRRTFWVTRQRVT